MLGGVDSDTISDSGNHLAHMNPGSFSVFEYDNNVDGGNQHSKYKTLRPPTFNKGSNGCLSFGGYYSMKKNVVFRYEQEFQELQLILLWFPEEVAIRLTNVEYELFKQVHPIEYLRHATLDMNNFKQRRMSNSKKDMSLSSSRDDSQTDVNRQTTTAEQQLQQVTRSVQDLIVRYKEVSSWIKKLIQSQPTAEKRLAIILSAIRCAITCWNIGNFNSSREIWLGLK